MSGMVAKRLFALLPNHMPIAAKLGMIESLWKHSSPSSRETLQIDSESQPQAVIAKVRKHFEDKLNHQIPENFTRRFDWLAGSDSEVKQQLLNHFRSLELNVVGEALEPKFEVLSRHLQENSSVYMSGTQMVSIGNHHLELEFDNRAAIAEREIAIRARAKKERAAMINEAVEKIKLGLAIIVGAFFVFVIWWIFLK